MKSEVKIFSAPGYIAGIKSMANSWRITVDTQDTIPGEALGVLADMKDTYGYFLFKLSPIEKQDADLPDYKPIEKGDKTPSKRMRAVLFRLWEQEGKQQFETADQHYKYYMEKLIDHYKAKLG